MGQLYDQTQDEAVYQSVRTTLEAAQSKAAAAVNGAMVAAYWEIGRRIVEAQGERPNTASILLHTSPSA